MANPIIPENWGRNIKFTPYSMNIRVIPNLTDHERQTKTNKDKPYGIF